MEISIMQSIENISKKYYPFVSLIISNMNGKNLLRECITSLLNQKYLGFFEIIVVDAGSIDGSPEMVEQEFPTVKLLKRKRIGIGEAINDGLRVAKGDVLAFDVNNDEFFPSEWLQNIVDGLLENPNAGAVGGLRLYYGTTNLVDEAGIVFNYLGIPSSYIRAKLENVPKGPRKVDYVGLPLFHRRILNCTGLIDEKYFLYQEDSDFCAQVRATGLDVVFIPKAISYHRRNTTIGKSSSLSTFYERRNQIRFIIKNFSTRRLILALLWYSIILPAVEALMFFPFMKKLFSSKSSRLSFLSRRTSKENFRAVLAAMCWNIQNFNSSYAERVRIKYLISHPSDSCLK